jgi:hypothetical protein
MNINRLYQDNPEDRTPDAWPLVDPKDDGIRPAGEPDACFYCSQKVGQPHALDCVVVKKKVVVRYTVLAIIDVPHSWGADRILHCENNGGSRYNIAEWGSTEFVEVHCDFIKTEDETPSRDIRDDDEE